MSFLPLWAWRWIAIAFVALAFGATVGVKVYVHEEGKVARVTAAFDAFKSEVAVKGHQAQLEAQAQEVKQKGVEDALRKDLAGADAAYAAAVARLSQHAPGRPDGSVVPTANCSLAGPAKPPAGEWVPLADYRALEGRAAYDAQTVTLYRDYVEGLVQAGVLAVR